MKATATNLNAQSSTYFRQRNAAGQASLYTQDATLVELLPRLSMMTGRPQIQQHIQQVLDAKATELQSTVTTAQAMDADRQLVGGDYTLTVGNKRILGHFVQVLRREGGVWRIASHVFARPEPVTVAEVTEYRGN